METIEKVKENGQAEKSNAQKCADELDEILKKYNCTMVCNPTYMYGRQKVWVPGIVEIKK